jgi:hypothetical protein
VVVVVDVEAVVVTGAADVSADSVTSGAVVSGTVALTTGSVDVDITVAGGVEVTRDDATAVSPDRSPSADEQPATSSSVDVSNRPVRVVTPAIFVAVADSRVNR